MRTAKMFWRDMCLGTFRHGARFLIIPLVVVLMTAGFAEYVANLYEAGTIAGSGTAKRLLSVCYAGNVYL